MKKRIIIYLAALMLVFTSACASGEGNQNTGDSLEAEDSGSSMLVPDDGSKESEKADAVPAMTTEQQEICDKYLTPLLYSNFFVGDYFSKTLETEWAEGGIITIYQDLAGADVWTGLVNEQYRIPASDVEGVIMGYFPFDAQTIQIIAGDYYSSDTDSYTMIERGGGPREIAVTGSGKLENGIIEISYEMYDPGNGDNMEKAADGLLQVELFEDGHFNYINNEMTFHRR